MKRPVPSRHPKSPEARRGQSPQASSALAGVFQQGLALHRQGRLDEAGLVYQSVLKADPQHFDALHLSGVIAYQRGNPTAAVELIGRALEIDTTRAPAHNNLGNALKSLSRIEDALASYEAALRLRPDYVEALNNRGNVLRALNRLDEALGCYDQAIAIKPDFAEVLCNRGLTLRELNRLDLALASYDQAIQLRPGDAESHYQRGVVLQGLFRLDEAAASYTRAIEIRPDHGGARWTLPFLPLMRFFSGEHELEASRVSLLAALEHLDKSFAPDRLAHAHEAVGSCQPFYLAYQEVDNRPVLERYGQICHRLMSNWQRRVGLAPARGLASGPIRVGIVGEQIRSHSVWHAITRGWLAKLDTNRFELHVFHLGGVEDEQTRFARERSASFTDRRASLHDWARAIVDKKVEVLIYPEIGMHQLTAQLASLRLAPVQIAAWGHPETTGLPTIDHYLSAELFESEGSERAYTENLIRLPNLGCAYERLPVVATAPDLRRLGLDGDEPILLCPGKPFKYAPHHDWVWPAIAKKLGPCKLVFFSQQASWTSMLGARLERAFESAGLRRVDHVVLAPWLKPDEFYGLMKRADVYLDTMGFSGFNTAMQAVDCALPIVTRQGRFMRGRLASAILERMSLTELVARDEDDYIELAVRLARDSAYRDDMRRKISERRAVLYDDLEPIRALEDFLLDQCRGRGLAQGSNSRPGST